MTSRVVQIILIVLAVALGSTIIHIGVGLITGQAVANRLKEYEQRWKDDDARIQRMESEIQKLEAKRDALRADAAKEIGLAGAAAKEGADTDKDLRNTSLTPDEQAKKNKVQPLGSQKIGSGKSIGKGSLEFKKPDGAEAAQ